MNLYRYVGPKGVAEAALADLAGRISPGKGDDLGEWLRSQKNDVLRDGTIPSTFVVDESGKLWLGPRRCEHVAIARGHPVLAAGEMFWLIHPPGIGTLAAVVRITNQSTGYCPESGSWNAIVEALDSCRIAHPSFFDPVFVFRRCPACSEICVVKDELWECPICGEPLPEHWNLD